MTPARAQPVTIRLPELGDLPARVDTSGRDAVVLVLSVPPDARFRALGEAPAVVEYTTPTGVHRIAGALRPAGEDPAVVELVPDAAGHAVVQRREYARVDAVLRVEIRIEEPVAAVTLNVSANGALISDPVGLPVGAAVRLELHIDDHGPPVVASGRVVRETADGAKGVRLETVAEADRERLVRFVLRRQSAQLRARGRA